MSQDLLTALLLHALVAAAVAVAAALVCRRVRHPAVAHGLWLIVLLKLLAPPLVTLAVVPAWGSSAALPAGLPAVLAEAAARPPGDPWQAPSAAALILAAMAAGSLVILVLTVVRARAFRAALRRQETPPPEALERRVDELADGLGLGRRPRLRLVEAPISPLLWPGWHAELVLPTELLARLAPDELDTVLAHELAHARRRDHLVRYLELAAAILFWWHPLVAWARGHLRRSEEAACDVLVAEALPGSGRAYARALLEAARLAAEAPSPRLPALAPAAVAPSGKRNHFLKERLTMILDDRVPQRLRSSHRVLLVALAASLLLVAPTFVGAGEGEPAAANEGEPVPTPFLKPAPEPRPESADAGAPETRAAAARRLHVLGRQAEELQLQLGTLSAEIERLTLLVHGEGTHRDLARRSLEQARALRQLEERERARALRRAEEGRRAAELAIRARELGDRLESRTGEQIGESLRLEREEARRALAAERREHLDRLRSRLEGLHRLRSRDLLDPAGEEEIEALEELLEEER